jgi:hypothetical protein
VRFQKIVKTGEDIYLDSILTGSVLGMYLATARRQAFAETRRGRVSSSDGLSFEALIRLWWAASLEDHTIPFADHRYHEPLRLLMALTSRLLAIRQKHASVTSRCETRSLIYKQSWSQLVGVLSGLPLLDKRLTWVPSHLVRAPDRQSQGVSVPGIKPAMPMGLSREIETHLAASSSDITPLIRSIVGYDDPEVVATSRWDYHIPAHPMVDRALVGRLRAIFASYSEREKAVSRGLPCGRIDSRRLYRAPVTGRCFKELDSRPSMDWNVTLLIDASGSMRGPKWRMVENTVSTIHEALKGYRNSLAAYAYFEIDGICMVSSLIRDNHVFSVPPCGQTASGQAIIAAALFMQANRRRKLLIHVTDGESNYGCSVSHGIGFCRQNNIHLITLGCGCRDKKALQEQYGNIVEFIGGFRQLPQAIERLLRWTFLYGSKMPPLKSKMRDDACDESPGEARSSSPEDEGKERLE